MPRKLIIVGNGLGMALDPVHFSLNAALSDIWDRGGFLSPEQKSLIERCLNRQGAPEGEHELDQLHRAVTYCKALNQIGVGEANWLTDDGQNFPEITAQYIHKVATKLHNYGGALPSAFETALVDFVKQTKSHVATLNYDKLLYNSFLDNDVFGSYDRAYLVDGMVAGGFSADTLERRYRSSYGYYLHLHGSPLFVNRGGLVRKLSRDELTLNINEASEHIVLTHVRHKPSVIAASAVLSTYWDYLRFALSEAVEVILFGYSGLDDHLNILLRPYLKAKTLRVVEWDGAGSQGEREIYWRHIFKDCDAEIIRLADITDFSQWE
ncbi:hypothetical protein [Chromobacterium subtsugae]|uniref:hypothetical protein n=1 Tax=Chromobacterium subtsugae TaxID=251747 RepID=UPI0009BB0E5E|nr:hypothetical protein [Chromobacterium subtsugae]